MKIALGTAQFGIPYGITRNSNELTRAEVFRILDICRENHVLSLDTARAYGTSEEVLGAYPQLPQFDVITKIPKLPGDLNTQEKFKFIKECVQESLKNLKIDKLYGLLLHNISDLLEDDGNEIHDLLLSFKESGLVQKIGGSAYYGEKISDITESKVIDLIQLPLNILDQRPLQSGLLDDLKSKKIEIHVRSVFLQGIITNPNHPNIPQKFHALQRHLQHIQDAHPTLNLITLAIGYIKSLKQVDKLVLGVENQNHILEILSEYDKNTNEIEFKNFAWTGDTSLIDPRKWS